MMMGVQNNNSNEFDQNAVAVKYSQEERYQNHSNAKTDVTDLYLRMKSFGCVLVGITKNIIDLGFLCAMSAPKRLRNMAVVFFTPYEK